MANELGLAGIAIAIDGKSLHGKLELITPERTRQLRQFSKGARDVFREARSLALMALF
jgi:hypothetical protein